MDNVLKPRFLIFGLMWIQKALTYFGYTERSTHDFEQIQLLLTHIFHVPMIYAFKMKWLQLPLILCFLFRFLHLQVSFSSSSYCSHAPQSELTRVPRPATQIVIRAMEASRDIRCYRSSWFQGVPKDPTVPPKTDWMDPESRKGRPWATRSITTPKPRTHKPPNSMHLTRARPYSLLGLAAPSGALTLLRIWL